MRWINMELSLAVKGLNVCDFRSRTAFERSKTDVFRIRTHNVGPLKKIRYCALYRKSLVSEEFVTVFTMSSPPSCSSLASGSSTTTRVWTPAGSWTEWRWQTWSGLTSGSTLLVTAGWARWREMAFLSETCWAAWTLRKYQNVCKQHTFVLPPVSRESVQSGAKI